MLKPLPDSDQLTNHNIKRFLYQKSKTNFQILKLSFQLADFTVVSPKAKCPILAHSKDVLLTGACQGWARGGRPPVPLLGIEDAC